MLKHALALAVAALAALGGVVIFVGYDLEPGANHPVRDAYARRNSGWMGPVAPIRSTEAVQRRLCPSICGGPYSSHAPAARQASRLS